MAMPHPWALKQFDSNDEIPSSPSLQTQKGGKKTANKHLSHSPSSTPDLSHANEAHMVMHPSQLCKQYEKEN